MPRGLERQLAYVIERRPDGRTVVRAVPATGKGGAEGGPSASEAFRARLYFKSG